MFLLYFKRLVAELRSYWGLIVEDDDKGWVQIWMLNWFGVFLQSSHYTPSWRFLCAWNFMSNYWRKTKDNICKKRNCFVYLFRNFEAKLLILMKNSVRLTKLIRRVYEGLPKNFTHELCLGVRDITWKYGKCTLHKAFKRPVWTF